MTLWLAFSRKEKKKSDTLAFMPLENPCLCGVLFFDIYVA